MDLWLLIQAFIMGLVEGITEFLPISSTGHLIITATLLDFWTKEKRDVFEVAIQLGAILSVCYEYRERLINVIQGLFQNKPEAWRFSINVAIAFLPAAILGFLTIHAIKEHLFNSVSVAIALIVGGFIILWAEKRPHAIRVESVDDMHTAEDHLVVLLLVLLAVPGACFEAELHLCSVVVGDELEEGRDSVVRLPQDASAVLCRVSVLKQTCKRECAFQFAHCWSELVACCGQALQTGLPCDLQPQFAVVLAD